MLSPCHSRREPRSSCPPRPPARHGASAGLNASLTSMRDCFPTCRRVALPHVLTCYRNQNSFKPRLPYHHGRQTKLGMLGIRFRRNSARRSEEHTSELQSHSDLVCRLLLEKK